MLSRAFLGMADVSRSKQAKNLFSRVKDWCRPRLYWTGATWST